MRGKPRLIAPGNTNALVFLPYNSSIMEATDNYYAPLRLALLDDN